ncbi:MAG: hypothetical protein COY68_01330 [Candidatus Levybacteria bacterium CG_4_10_14_0_8_um_filter_35_23]|nr:MAG: hypothetical protein COY68_01330 [Candidatus Levybacteria bacterium CG_4_10_14_0_8_um_filter_35_23]
MEILRILLGVLIIIFLPLGQIAKFDLGFKASVTAFDIGLLFLVFFWIFYCLFRKKKIKAALTKPIILFVSVCFVSLLLNTRGITMEQLLVSVSYLFRWALYSIVYFIAVSLNKDKKKGITAYLFYSGIIILFLGFIQVFFYPSLKNLYYLGWDEHMYRLFSSFLDPNFTGIYFVVIFFLGIYLYFLKNKKRYIVLCILLLIGIFLTYSRTALVTLLLSTASFLVISNRKKIIIPIVLLVFLVTLLFPKTFKSEGTDYFRFFSVNARISSMQHGLKIFIDHPFFGIGFNSYRYFQEKYGFELTDYTIPSRAAAGVENSFVFILATTGIVGVISYLFILFKMFKLTLLNKSKILPKITFSILIGLIGSSMFINSLFYTFIMFTLWVIVGITENN